MVMVGCPGILVLYPSFVLCISLVPLSSLPSCMVAILTPSSIPFHFPPRIFHLSHSHSRLIFCICMSMQPDVVSPADLFLSPFSIAVVPICDGDNVLGNILSGQNPIAFNMTDPLPLFIVQVRFLSLNKANAVQLDSHCNFACEIKINLPRISLTHSLNSYFPH